MATTAENQNNALAGGADNSINDPDWNKKKFKKEGIKDFVPKTKMARAKYADKAPKINLRKAYQD